MTDPGQTIQTLQSRVAELERELAETLDTQTAMSEVLGIIAASPSDLGEPLQAIIESATRLSASAFCDLWLVEGSESVLVAQTGSGSAFTVGARSPLEGTLISSVLRDGQAIRLDDLYDVAPNHMSRAQVEALVAGMGNRSMLLMPLGTRSEQLAVMFLLRDTVRPFSDRDVAIARTFADQAVIAIENARLFNELRERNQEVTEALDQQSSTATVLAMISRSPGQVEDVLVEVAREAMRLCGGDEAYLAIGPDDGEIRRMDITAEGVRWYNAREYGLVPERPADTAYLEERTIHVYGTTEEMLRRFPAMLNAPQDGLTVLATPFRTVNGVVGFLNVRRLEIRPFSEREIGILETFADQAVIAIENARLFNELQERNREVTEALDRQTAMAEVLEIISRSPADLQPVLKTIAAAARRLLASNGATIWQAESGRLTLSAVDGTHPPAGLSFPLEPTSVTGHAFVKKAVVHLQVARLSDEERAQYPHTLASRMGSNEPAPYQVMLAVPMLRGDQSIGVLVVVRSHDTPYTEAQIETLRTFADQAVIAIENARLFNELQERNREVTEALDRQTAMAEVLEIISRSATDAQPVLDAVTERAAQLCDAEQCVVHAIEGNTSRLASRYVRNDHVVASYPAEPSPIDGRHLERAVTDQRVQHFFGTLEELAVLYPRAGLFAAPVAGERITVLSVPLIRDNVVIGVLQPTRPNGRPFDANQISLVEAFADQAVIAIENARLFNELQAKTEELGKLNIELETASRHKSDFLANMSHELRTPLNAIIGYSELLQEECADLGQEGFIPDLRKIHSAGTHLLTLISGILDLAKVEAGRMTMYLEDFDIAQLVGEVDAVVRPLVEKNANAFAVSCSPDVGRMRADLVKTRQVLFNLLSNAAKFTSSGNIWLTVERVADPDVVRFAVRDSGIGISEEQMSRLFEAFSQADSSTHAKYGGTGLGLSLSRHFCLMMGGDIVVDTAPGEGSTFTVTLPAVVVEQAPTQSSSNAASGDAR